MSDDERPPVLWHREAQLLDVSFPERTIELIVIPYETETVVAFQSPPLPADRGLEGKMLAERVARGAFDGIERRANRIRVNRDHRLDRTVGRALALHPSRAEGLVATVKISHTDLGDETLTLAQDGILDASAGFAPMTGGLRWLARNAYEVTKAWLGHIALTPDPAYEDATVLAVRSADAPEEGSRTPNLDLVRSWRREDQLASHPLYR